MADKQEIAVLSAAGIEGADTFAEFLADMDSKAVKTLQDVPPIKALEDYDDYRYCKAALATYRKVKKEAEDGRKRITGELDRAKKACMQFVGDSIAPLNAAIETMAGLQKGYEDDARAAKRARLEAWWERAYPMLALCTGEASEPLVPFERVFDPDWTRRVGELGKDDAAQDAMTEIAAGIADAQSEIESAGLDPDVRSLALSHLFETMDPCGNIAWATEQARRQRDLERVHEATVPIAVCVDQERESAPQAASQDGRHEVALSLPCEPKSERVLCVWVDSDEELAFAREAMKAAGLHGCIGRVI